MENFSLLWINHLIFITQLKISYSDFHGINKNLGPTRSKNAILILIFLVDLTGKKAVYLPKENKVLSLQLFSTAAL